jgi:Uma2 family endonuclease
VTLLDQPKLMTTEELEALPDDGTERWLIDGELRERDMTKRARGHSRIEANFCGELHAWNKRQPEPRGEVLVGEAGVRLRKDPDTTVGIDVAYISAETAALNTRDDRIVDGIPLLVIEVLSPSDKTDDIEEKVESYLACGVPHVWIASARLKSVIAHRRGAPLQAFDINQTISAEPHLPGLRITLKDIFS